MSERWGPGFRFHPTDEELILYYLKRKICRKKIIFDPISEIDVYKTDPQNLPGLSKLKNGDRQWFFFSLRDWKYSSGGRSSRGTGYGYWKATGKDRAITCDARSVGLKKTLVFYRGRAPSGERTDWVMHEYTLDEEELKRCPAQDYYALYKIYKKSGPGPKNGEQYGAPFREEDWEDDENAVDTVATEQVTPLQQFSQYATSFDDTANCQKQTQMNGLDAFLKRIVNDPLFEPTPLSFGNVQANDREKDTLATSVDQSLVERNAQERVIVPPCGQFNGVQPCCNITQSTGSKFPKTSQLASSSNKNKHGAHESVEDFVEGFLEIDDLLGPEPTQQINNNPVEDDLRIEDFDGLCELDIFPAESMFLQDVGDAVPAFQTYSNNFGNQIGNPIPISYPDNLEDEVVNQAPNSYFNNFQTTEIVQPISQRYNSSFDNDMANRFNYQMPLDSDVANQPWMQNQSFSLVTPAVPNQGSVIPPSSGMVYARGTQNQIHSQNEIQIQNQKGDGNEGEESWFSSALWSFVETIPTTPASAAESTILVIKAFEQISSFGKRGDSMKVSWLNTKTIAGDLHATCPRSRKRCNRSFLLFSLIGVVCGILWVFTVASTRPLDRCLS